jgi:hypothetical protein
MFNRNKAIVSIILAGLYVIASPAGAATVAESGVESEVNSCVAEVRDRVDYSDAAKVRHDVTAIERRTVGYTLKISTSLYGETEGEVIRAYAATCIVNGDNKPLSFDIADNS